MASISCPFCNSTDLRLEDGRTWCRSCQREIVELGEGAASASTENKPSSRATEANVPLKCPFCNAASVVRKDDKLFCQACGFEVDSTELPNAPIRPAIMIKCPVCSQRLSAKAESCPACGHPLREIPSPYSASATVVIYAIKVCVVAWIISLILLVIYEWTLANAVRSFSYW